MIIQLLEELALYHPAAEKETRVCATESKAAGLNASLLILPTNTPRDVPTRTRRAEYPTRRLIRSDYRVDSMPPGVMLLHYPRRLYSNKKKRRHQDRRGCPVSSAGVS